MLPLLTPSKNKEDARQELGLAKSLSRESFRPLRGQTRLNGAVLFGVAAKYGRHAMSG